MDIDTGSKVTVYANKYYNKTTEGANTLETLHAYANGQLVATAEDDGTDFTLYYDHTDHLGGTSVMTNEDGEVEQIVDYYPFGDIRFNQQINTFDEQRKFTGHEYDGTTDLTYMNARYYAGVAAKFVSQDPLFLEIGSNNFNFFMIKNQYQLKEPLVLSNWLGGNKNIKGNMFLTDYLFNPQKLNSYSYVINNPLIYVDPQGESERKFTEKAINWFSGNGWNSDSDLINISDIPMEISAPEKAIGPVITVETISAYDSADYGPQLNAGRPIRPSQEARNNIADNIDSASELLDSYSQGQFIQEAGKTLAVTAGSMATGIPQVDAGLKVGALYGEAAIQLSFAAADVISTSIGYFSDLVRKGSF